ncbi:hypothetical protein F442_03012, partial [Phytophthora nicotianae P10297]
GAVLFLTHVSGRGKMHLSSHYTFTSLSHTAKVPWALWRPRSKCCRLPHPSSCDSLPGPIFSASTRPKQRARCRSSLSLCFSPIASYLCGTATCLRTFSLSSSRQSWVLSPAEDSSPSSIATRTTSALFTKSALQFSSSSYWFVYTAQLALLVSQSSQSPSHGCDFYRNVHRPVRGSVSNDTKDHTYQIDGLNAAHALSCELLQ